MHLTALQNIEINNTEDYRWVISSIFINHMFVSLIMFSFLYEHKQTMIAINFLTNV